MTATEIDFFRTNDMGLAAYLLLNGQPIQQREWQGTTCYWIFLLVPSITDMVQCWAGRQALVEPIEYNKCFNKVKKELLSDLHGARG